MPTIDWASTTNGYFSTASNWVGGSVPGPSDDVVLDDTGAGGYFVESVANATVNSIQTGSTFEELTIDGGTFTATAGTGMGVFHGAIFVEGATFVAGGALAFNAANQGVSIGPGGTLQLAGDTTTTAGLIEFSGGSAALTGSYNLTLGGDILQSGAATATLGAGMTINVGSAFILNENSGTGALTIDTSVITGSGGGVETLGPGGVVINGTTIQGLSGFLIDGNGGVVTLNSVDVIGAQLQGYNGGAIVTGDLGSVLDGTVGAILNRGVLQVAGATALTIDGLIDNLSDASISVAQTGVLYVAYAGASLAQAGAILLNGGVVTDSAPGATLYNIDNTISGTGFIQGSLNLVNEAAGVIDASTGRLEIMLPGSTLTNAGLIETTGPGSLLIKYATIANTGGTVTSSKSIELGSSTITGGTVVLTAGAALKNAGASMISGASVINAGAIYGGTISLTIDGGVSNSGLLEADKGDLTITGAVTGAGQARIVGGGVLELDGVVGEKVTFADNGPGTLILGDSAAFTGTVAGFSKTGANQIDLKDIAYDASDTVAYSAKTHAVTVSDAGGTVLAAIILKDSYAGSTFTLSDGGAEGTVLTDPRAVAFASAAARLGGVSASSATPALHPPAPLTPLLAHS
jgi:fibronectin-binding autotransporter adhesin